MLVNADLHIHSVLSPCADLLMGYKNIIQKLKEFDIKVFSITDHNSAKNSRIFKEAADREGLIFVPGMEIQTAEEIHVLSYFYSIEALENFQKIIYSGLAKIKNKEEIYGYQLLIDIEDEFIEKEEAFLAGSVSYGIDEVFKIIKEYGGVAVPAHIDRTSSVISNLGYIPELDFDAFEVYIPQRIEEIKKKYKITKPILSSSDSHFVHTIERAKMVIDIERYDLSSVLDAIKKNMIKI